MKNAWLALCLLMSSWQLNADQLRIFSCEPEWAALASEIGSDKVDVFSATTGLQDVHKVMARPNLIAKVRRADLVICTGASLEAAWLPLLLRKAGNSKVLPGQRGYLEVSSFVEMKEIPASLDRSEGDVHASGNPHIQTDPRNYIPIAQALTQRLVMLDDENAEWYRQRLDSFEQRWREAVKRWEVMAGKLKGMRVVTQHKSWVYMNDWLGLEEVAVLEPKPGLPPSASHLAQITNGLKSKPATLIIRAAYQSPRASEWLSEETGLPTLALPFTVGGSEQAKDLFALFDETISSLLKYAD